MEASSLFDKLVLDLSSQERRDLLEKIQGVKNVSVEPLLTETFEQEETNFDNEYDKLSLFRKIILFILSLFTGKKRRVLVEEYLLKKLRDRIYTRHPGLVDFSRKVLLKGFRDEIESLSRAISIFKEPLHRVMSTDRGSFFAFLISMELEFIQQRIIEETDPVNIYDSQHFTEVAEVRGEMERRFSHILDSISPEDRTRIYQYALSLDYFNQLCGFNFDDIVMQFDNNRFGGRGALGFMIAKNKLMKLSDILQSVGYPPPSDALKAVFLFHYHSMIDDPDFNMQKRLEQSLEEADNGFNYVRRFNNKVPVADIVKCILKNYNYRPQKIKGGEDWFVLFKNYWQNRFDAMFRTFYKEKKVRVLIEQVHYFLEADFVSEPQYYNQNLSYENLGIKYYLSVIFIKNFYERLFLQKINRYMKVLLINGNFFKKENRSDFTDAFNGMNVGYEMIGALDKDVSPAGESGARLEQLNSEVIKSKEVRKRAENLFKSIDARAKKIVEDGINCFTIMINVLDGILYGKIGGKYDTISNLKSIGGRENNDLIAAWRSSINYFTKGLQLLKDIYQLESRG
ncbi:MAG: hypothetical protein JW881_03720 [Spirochaetales bacterium]|nr:hypothetical protein [Spirochaetales bacterium]